MSIRPHNKQQLPLVGMEQAQCACGCREYFMRIATGRKREYINGTHKKRAARAREKLARTETTVSLTPKGLVYFNTKDESEFMRLWEGFTPVEQRVVAFMCENDLTPVHMTHLVERLFK